MEQAASPIIIFRGCFEFTSCSRVFLPLFREHREYFYDWCDIGSIYGAPGRIAFGAEAVSAAGHAIQEMCGR